MLGLLLLLGPEFGSLVNFMCGARGAKWVCSFLEVHSELVLSFKQCPWRERDLEWL